MANSENGYFFFPDSINYSIFSIEDFSHIRSLNLWDDSPFARKGAYRSSSSENCLHPFRCRFEIIFSDIVSDILYT